MRYRVNNHDDHKCSICRNDMIEVETILTTFPFAVAGDNRERILRSADPLADEQSGHPSGR